MNINNINSPKRRFRSFEGEWKQRKLGNIASMHARIGWQNLRTSEFLDNGDYYLITGTDFLNGRINFEKCHYVNKERYQQDKKIQVGKGSILITKDGTLGKVVLVTDLNKPATLNAGVFNVVVKVPSINETYLYQYLAAPFLMDYVSKRATGGTIKHLNQGILVDFPVNFPSYKEQETIGQFLGCLDNAVTLHQHKLDKLKNLKKAYLAEMLPTKGESVPKRRFPSFEGEWEKHRLISLCDVFSDGDWIEAKDQSNSGIRLLQTGNVGITEYLAKSGNMKWISEETFENLHCKEVMPGDILISRLPDPAGRACIVPNTGQKMITSVDCTIVRTRSEISNSFLVQYLSSTLYFNEVSTCLAGGTRQRISRSNLADIMINIPTSKMEQDKIGHFFQNLDNSIALQQQKLDKLNDLKKAYLNELFV